MQARRIGRAVTWEEYRSRKLYEAAAQGHTARADELLAEGTADPDWRNPEGGLTPLVVAAVNGRAACLLSLLRAGADIYAVGAAACGNVA